MHRVQHDGQEVAAVLTTIAVAASLQGLGVGRRLVDDLEQFFQQGATSEAIAWKPWSRTTAARAFYGRLGVRGNRQEGQQRRPCEGGRPMNTATISGVSVLMPTYNEAGNIEDLIRETAAALEEAGVQSV